MPRKNNNGPIIYTHHILILKVHLFLILMYFYQSNILNAKLLLFTLYYFYSVVYCTAFTRVGDPPQVVSTMNYHVIVKLNLSRLSRGTTHTKKNGINI